MEAVQLISVILAVGGAIVTVIWRVSKKFHCVEEVKEDVVVLREELRANSKQVKEDLEKAAANLKESLKEEIANSRKIHEKLEDKIDEIIRLLLSKDK